MGFLATLWERFKYDVLPRAGRPAYDLAGTRRVLFIWMPLMILLMCVVIGLVSVIAGAAGSA